MKKILLVLSLLIMSTTVLQASEMAKPKAELYFISPGDGQTLQNPIVIRFGLKNMGVAPAGSDIKNTGHHHLLIDTGLPALDLPIPNDKNHRHFGGGQTETSLELSPGMHTLQLLLGDFSHIPHMPTVLSEPITITVE
jgi:hypothetical protein